MNIAEYAIKKRTITLVMTFFILVGGFYLYDELGRLEDPEFTIKEALVVTLYPGATPKEVEEEVTEVIETKIQELSQLDTIESISKAGISIITVTIKDKFDKKTLPQVWDELRRKVGDGQSQLPPGVRKSLVYDDYGDVYGVLIAITGKGYSYKELKDHGDFLKRELLLVPDVAKVIAWGEQQEQIFVEISRSRMSQLGISLDLIYATLARQNLVVPAGSVRVGDAYIRIQPTGEIVSVREISNLLIRGATSDKLIYLKDIAKVSRGYIDPPQKHMRFNGQNAIALGISSVSGGNVVTMGNAIKKRLKVLEAQTPLGMELHYVYFQAENVSKSINSFILNLLEAIAIVIAVLMVFMGVRSGLLIGMVLLLTVCSTVIFMHIYGINLQRISLGALIIALGMLVDNAIVVTEGMLVRIESGMERIKAAREVVSQTMWPLFGATVVAILAFAAIGLSQDSTGEYTRSLFQVMLISLGMSWLIAITITPLFCAMFIKVKKNAVAEDPYKGIIFFIYKKFLKLCIRFRWVTIALVLVMMGFSLYAFTLLEDSFFPDSTNQQFFVHYWLPEGTDIRKTSSDLKEIESYIKNQEGVKFVSTFVGEGAPRFILVYGPEKSYNSYGLVIVTVTEYNKIDGLMKNIRSHINKNYLDANPKLEKIRLGPGGGYAIEARFSGKDHTILRQLSNQAKAILYDDKGSVGVRDDWRERVKIIRPQYSEVLARRAGISRENLSEALETTFTGTQVGIFREKDELIPIISRATESERVGVDNIYDIQIWSHTANKVVPIQQVVTAFKTEWEDPIIQRRNKKLTITTQSDPKEGNASVVFERVKSKIENIPLPLGYEFEWGGEYEDAKDAQAGLAANLPITLILMILVTITLFNAIRQPLIIWLTVPLAVIGVSVGLLLTGESFGFMALLGFLSLIGMLIKNAIVLIDEIDIQIRQGKEKFIGILDASVSRMRPVTMAAITTILGMTPLLGDVFFKAMAVTIMAGLAFATILTLIIVPVFYAVFFRVPYPSKGSNLTKKHSDIE